MHATQTLCACAPSQNVGGQRRVARAADALSAHARRAVHRPRPRVRPAQQRCRVVRAELHQLRKLLDTCSCTWSSKTMKPVSPHAAAARGRPDGCSWPARAKRAGRKRRPEAAARPAAALFEQSSFDLHSSQKQLETTGVFDMSTRGSSRGFIWCAARPDPTRTHRERCPCAGAVHVRCHRRRRTDMSVLSTQVARAPCPAPRRRAVSEPPRRYVRLGESCIQLHDYWP